MHCAPGHKIGSLAVPLVRVDSLAELGVDQRMIAVDNAGPLGQPVRPIGEIGPSFRKRQEMAFVGRM